MDSLNTLEFEDYFVIMSSTPTWKESEYLKKFDGKKVNYGFSYDSGKNEEWLSVEDIRQLIIREVDPLFRA